MLVHELPLFHDINDFLEDTCIVMVLAYLLSRGNLLITLFDVKRRRRDQIALAIIFGLIGGSEMIFPGERYPYVTFTLASAFAGYAGGLLLGILTASVMTLLGVIALLVGGMPLLFPLYILSIFSAALIGSAILALRHLWENWRGRHVRKYTAFLVGATLAGAAGEAPHALLPHLFPGLLGPSFSWNSVSFIFGANSFGCLLLGRVLWDAYERRLGNQQRLREEQELATLRLSQLSELQARLHPHFLFNALASIAGLCLTSPRKAEEGITDLAVLLRQFLRAPSEVCIPLHEELSLVRTYLALEHLRLENRLSIQESVPEGALMFPVPRFSLQVPTENAVQHGIAPFRRPGKIMITVRCHRHYLTLAVGDDGAGQAEMNSKSLDEDAQDEERLHGLTLLSARLRLAYGGAARLRLFRSSGRGAVCVLWLPHEGWSK